MSGPSASPRRMASRTSWTMPSLAAAIADGRQAACRAAWALARTRCSSSASVSPLELRDDGLVGVQRRTSPGERACRSGPAGWCSPESQNAPAGRSRRPDRPGTRQLPRMPAGPRRWSAAVAPMWRAGPVEEAVGSDDKLCHGVLGASRRPADYDMQTSLQETVAPMPGRGKMGRKPAHAAGPGSNSFHRG